MSQLTQLPPKQDFERILNGKQTALFYLRHGSLQAAFSNYGARLVSLLVPAADGRPTEVTLGLGSIEAYVQARSSFFGATVGRYANRIAFGRFALDGKSYQLQTNLPPHHLHGGVANFQEKIWDAQQPDDATVIFRYLSPDGEEGFPGNLQVTATYQLTEKGLMVRFEASTDQPTVVNLTNHAYFNLNGQGRGHVLDHELQINAAAITETDQHSIPTGRLLPVAGTPFDFRSPHAIGERIAASHEQIQFGSGYDHNFVLDAPGADGWRFAARAKGNQSGIVMEVYTTEPGMQLYCANFLKGTVRLRSGDVDIRHCGFCLETQHFPDSPNRPEFPTTRLNPGERFRSETLFQFL